MKVTWKCRFRCDKITQIYISINIYIYKYKYININVNYVQINKTF